MSFRSGETCLRIAILYFAFAYLKEPLRFLHGNVALQTLSGGISGCGLQGLLLIDVWAYRPLSAYQRHSTGQLTISLTLTLLTIQILALIYHHFLHRNYAVHNRK